TPVPAPPPPAPPPPAAPSASGPTTWSASSVYTAGMTVTENGVTYKANWWTQGADPAHNNGGLGTGQPWWQGAGTISDDALANGTTILSQVKAIQAAGGDVTISFGGAAGQEAALTAMTAANLQAGYQSVIDRYHVHSLDFDIEAPRSRISAPSRCAIRRW